MAFAIAFNHNNGAGEIDPMRITRNVGWGGAPDPLDSNLVFSALHNGAQAEEFAAYTDSPETWNPRFNTGRTYSTFPLLVGAFVNTSGERFYPGVFQTGGAGQYWRFRLWCSSIGNGYYQVGADMRSGRIAGYYPRAGTLRLYAIGA